MAGQGARAREQAIAVWQGTRRRAALAGRGLLSGVGGRVGQALRAWMLVDVAPGRLVPWLAIAFGLGIVLYFAAYTEPALWAALTLLTGAAGAVVLLRRRTVGFPVALAAAAMAAGFATATIRTAIVAHPVLPVALWNVSITGFVEVREERERSDRIVVRVHHMEAPRLAQPLDRVRVSVRKGTAPPVGAFVEFKARLSPPAEPLYPGGYDFARHIFFQQIGASGFVLGTIRTAAPPSDGGFWLGYASAVEHMRTAIDARIRAGLDGDRGAIASALITGKRDAITAPVNDAMYVSGLGHVLSISGYHMVVVVGIVFFALRASMAFLSGYHPTKKWAALLALAAAAFYLVLSGAEVATQRSFIMAAIVLVGVMADRAALTLRTLTIAAFAVLLLAPESLLNPSFQMSFAATLALIAGYERGVVQMNAGRGTPFAARAALWGGRELVFLTFSSILAGLATTLYAAFHFHRIAPYGVIANLLAMPLMSLVVMPAGLAGLALAPLGFDPFCWWIMGWGIDWMIAVALWVASLPGAVGRVTAFGVGPLLLGSLGLVVLCLLRSPLRLLGIALAAAAALWAARTPQPDVLIAPDASHVAIRTAEGRLAFVGTGNSNNAFAIQQWLGADADSRSPKDRDLATGIRCDADGCIGRLADGTIVAIARTLAAFEEDCRRAAVIVSTRRAPPGCAAQVIDPTVWRQSGALALHRTGRGFDITATRPPGYDRPWSHRPAQQAAASPARTPATGPTRDATPRAEDLEAGD